ncbi:hypothetical protein QOZ80_3BG0256850 [Eleusine coracana subsp. coracana]|nr:hypothetical protein QOZ80_3BG0256850 [Eleusine coracana subsp. coracana]
MQILRQKLLEASRRLPLFSAAVATHHRRAHAVAALAAPLRDPATYSLTAAPWAVTQRRGVKMLGSDVKLGNVIQRRGNKSTTFASRKRRSHSTGGTEGC